VLKERQGTIAGAARLTHARTLQTPGFNNTPANRTRHKAAPLQQRKAKSWEEVVFVRKEAGDQHEVYS
jgi:hypothetical protein